VRIMVTGAGGYIGSLLTERLLLAPSVEAVVATDQDFSTASLREPAHPKLERSRGRLEDSSFVRELERHLPLDAVIHAAFQMRTGYGRRAGNVAAANLASCRNVFEYCFKHQVGRLVYFSSAAAYGARAENRIDHFFREDEPLREDAYAYGVQKRLVEELLRAMYAELSPTTRVIVVRPCSVTGPRGQRSPKKAISLISFLKRYLPVIPEVSREWARQFLHEEDLVDAVWTLLRAPMDGYDVFNLAPHDYLAASDIASLLKKRTVRIPAWLAQLTFHSLWHLTRGGMPTAPGSINSFRYPINLDGRKIRRVGFEYRHSSSEGLLAERKPS